MKKTTLVLLLIISLLGAIAYLVLAPATAFSDKSKSVVIPQGKTDKETVIDLFVEKEIVKNGWAFQLLGSGFNIWGKIKPGKFQIKRSDNLINIVRMLRNNHQIEVKLVINKLRINEDLAKLIGKNFSTDSASAMAFLSNNDSLKQYSVDSNTVCNIIIPNTYTFYYITPLSKILAKLKSTSEDFWNAEGRGQKASAIGFSTKEIYTIASIVEEETNMEADKGKIASVYINRYHKGMNLGADPTVKFALKDFSLKRILFQHLSVASPYNTYRNKGLPPGPICTPSVETIDAVLNAPTTDYLFFVAKPDFSGYSNFSSNFAEHSKYAKQYQQALNDYLLRKKTKE